MVGNPSVSVELKGADGDARAALAAVPGVAEVSDRGDGRFQVEHTPDADPREAIFQLAVERGWVLTTLAAEKATLEDVFVRLTTREEETRSEEPVMEEV
jgi:ABC-type uncharacterized transport system ATPase subunit